MANESAKAAFARKLYALMAKKGMRQADLARASGLPRDNTSRYIRGASGPTPENLTALAKVLNVTPEDLFPAFAEQSIDQDPPAVDIKSSVGSPGLAWIRLNKLVSFATAVEIARLVQEDDARRLKAANGD